LQAIVSHYNRR